MWYDEVEKEVIRNPKQIQRKSAMGRWAAGVKHTAAIFRQWSTSELIEVGIYPFIKIKRDPSQKYGGFKCTKMGTVYQETTEVI